VTALGPEPDGATPLDDEDLEGLIPEHVTNRGELNQAEFENLLAALPLAERQADRADPVGLLTYSFLFKLHEQMFCDVWTWAGQQRKRETNIGVDPAQIAERVKVVLDDAAYWHAHGTYPADETAVRLHHRLVAIHPFPNGNGRCTRLIADLYLRSAGADRLGWGSSDLATEGDLRSDYLEALRAADAGDYEPLLLFATAS
jgi:Fic-DOC domain mobile mystery protein B